MVGFPPDKLCEHVAKAPVKAGVKPVQGRHFSVEPATADVVHVPGFAGVVLAIGDVAAVDGPLALPAFESTDLESRSVFNPVGDINSSFMAASFSRRESIRTAVPWIVSAFLT